MYSSNIVYHLESMVCVCVGGSDSDFTWILIIPKSVDNRKALLETVDPPHIYLYFLFIFSFLSLFLFL